MLINAQLRSKQEEIQPVRCDIACIVELSNAEFFDFQFNPLADHDFIKEHLPDLKTDEFHAIPCMLVLGEGVDDGILVDPQGYDYARYTAYIPMARQLLLFTVRKQMPTPGRWQRSIWLFVVSTPTSALIRQTHSRMTFTPR